MVNDYLLARQEKEKKNSWVWNVKVLSLEEAEHEVTTTALRELNWPTNSKLHLAL
jgi:hypothetical protein